MGLYLVSGKGGVGKTHLSTSLSYYLAQKERRVLQVEFTYESLYSVFFSKKVSFTGLRQKENFDIASWSGLDCLNEYVSKLIKSKRAAEIFLKFPIVKNLVESAPGLREVAVLGKLTADYREMNIKTDYDDIVFDAPSTGHFLSLLKVPFGLKNTVGVGPMKNQCVSIIETLKNSKEVKFILVKDDTKFSTQENSELLFALKKLFPERSDFLEIVNFDETGQNQQLHFPFLPSQNNWIESAEKLSQKWGEIL